MANLPPTKFDFVRGSVSCVVVYLLTSFCMYVAFSNLVVLYPGTKYLMTGRIKKLESFLKSQQYFLMMSNLRLNGVLQMKK